MEGQYFCFPLKVNEQEASGELYFFKPKKNKSQKGQGVYMVLALNMPALQKIEVHLIEKEHQVILKLKVANEAIKKQFALATEQLLNQINDKESILHHIEIELLSNTNKISIQNIQSDFRHLDLKV